MRIGNYCFKCLYEKEEKNTPDEAYLSEIRDVLNQWDECDSAPMLEYRFSKIYEKRFGKSSRYAQIKREFNDLMLSNEMDAREVINNSADPLKTSVFMARTGNYIDFAAVKDINPKEFMSLLSDIVISDADEKTYRSFVSSCTEAKKILLLADNCGEIVLDKLMIEQLLKKFPGISVSVLVRGEETLNDATVDDAEYVGLTKICKVIPNGGPIPGTIIDMLPAEALDEFNKADIIISKGQGNYETTMGCGKHVFFSFLCKCDAFMEYFKVPRFTGMFIEEGY